MSRPATANGEAAKDGGSTFPKFALPALPASSRLQHERFRLSIRFRNELPEPPSDAKLLLPPAAPAELAAFSLTSLEAAPPRRDLLLLEPGLGLPLGPLGIRAWAVPADAAARALHPDDAALLEGAPGEGAAPAGGAPPGPAAAVAAAAEVSWLLRTKYISSGRGAAGAGAPAPAAPAPAPAPSAAAPAADDREAQAAAVEATFAAARAPPVHARDPSLTAVEVLDVLPDEALAGRPLVLAAFDSDPAADAAAAAGLAALRGAPAALAAAARAAQLKVFMRRRPDGSGDRFVAYLLPAAPPAGADDEAAEVPPEALAGDYRWVREYDSAVKYDERGGTFLLRLDPAARVAAYSDLNTRVALRKRKRAGGAAGGDFLQPERFELRLPGEGGDEEEEGRPEGEGGGGGGGAPGGAPGPVPEAAAAGEAAGGADAGGGGADAGGGGADAGGGGAAAAAQALRDVFGSDDDDD